MCNKRQGITLKGKGNWFPSGGSSEEHLPKGCLYLKHLEICTSKWPKFSTIYFPKASWAILLNELQVVSYWHKILVDRWMKSRTQHRRLKSITALRVKLGRGKMRQRSQRLANEIQALIDGGQMRAPIANMATWPMVACENAPKVGIGLITRR